MSQLIPEERQVLDKIMDTWNHYVRLPEQHPAHREEFAHAIHELQRLVMSRPTARDEGWTMPSNDKLLGGTPYVAETSPLDFTKAAPLDSAWQNLSAILTQHEPTDEERIRMQEDGYGIIFDGLQGYAAVSPKTHLYQAWYLEERRAWQEAFALWFAEREAGRQVKGALSRTPPDEKPEATKRDQHVESGRISHPIPKNRPKGYKSGLI